MAGDMSDKPRQILFFSHYFPPEGNAPASRVHEMAKRWVRCGHRVTVITCAPNQPNGVVYDGYRNRISQRETIDGIDVIRVWTYLAANKGTIKRIMNYVSFMISATARSLFTRRPDIIIATSPQFFCGWAGVLCKWLRWRPFILEIRDIWPESIVTVGAINKGRLIRLLEWLEIRMYRAATRIVAVGEGYARQIADKSIPREKIDVVNNGVDREFYQPRDPDPHLIEKYHLQGKFVCAYIGTIGMACGLRTALDAAELLKQRQRNDVAIMLVGDGAVREELAEEARQRGLDNVIFTGRQDKSLMPAFLSIAGASLVHLRRSELFRSVLPSKIFEAAAMARPIILGVEGEAAQLVDKAGGGICIEPENAEQLVDAILRLADDPQLRQQLGQSGHDYIVEHFDRDKLANDYLEVINKVIG
jgi:hypothetical protein